MDLRVQPMGSVPFDVVSVNVAKSTRVADFRRQVLDKIGAQSDKLADTCRTHSLMLLSMGKVMQDVTADNEPTLLTVDYGVGQAHTLQAVFRPMAKPLHEANEAETRPSKRPLAQVDDEGGEQVCVVLHDVKRAKVEPGAADAGDDDDDQLYAYALDKLDEEWREYCAVPGTGYTSVPLSAEQMDDKEEFDATYPPLCDTCRDEPRRDCDYCGCFRCRRKVDSERLLTCGGYLEDSENEQTQCPRSVHACCLDPPILEPFVEDDLPEWYCNECYEKRLRLNRGVITSDAKVHRGKRTQQSKAATTKRKNWGGGYSTAAMGQDKRADRNTKRRGPIPGVAVGQTFFNRKVLSGWGVHCPPVGGIHSGNKDDGGCFSIVSSGGYDEDNDQGDELIYSGEGGRDLSGNKRTNTTHDNDQALTRGNLSLATACAARPIDAAGADAGGKWHKGLPVRVIRGYNKKITGKKRRDIVDKDPGHFKYEPVEGLRYDGLYKVVSYWLHERPKEGTSVYQFRMRRCDDEPAPWTQDGKACAANLSMIYPKEGEAAVKSAKAGGSGKNGGSDDDGPSTKKPSAFALPAKLERLVRADTTNGGAWAECVAAAGDYADFTDKVDSEFQCITCIEVPNGSKQGKVAMQLNCCKKVFCHACVRRWEAQLESQRRKGAGAADLCPQRCNADQMDDEHFSIDSVVSENAELTSALAAIFGTD